MLKLDKLPSVLTKNKFNEKGLVETKTGLLVPAYVASQLGFNHPGKFFLEEEFYPKLRELGVLPLCPFTACSEYMTNPNLSDYSITVREFMDAWDDFNETIGVINYSYLMPRSKILIANLDGSHDVDDGVSSETSYFPTKTGLPVLGIRSDVRSGENITARINPAISYFLKNPDFKHPDSKFITGYDNKVYDEFYSEVSGLVKKILKEN